MRGDDAYRRPESIAQSLRVFDWAPATDDPVGMEKVLLRVPPNVHFADGLGARDVTGQDTVRLSLIITCLEWRSHCSHA